MFSTSFSRRNMLRRASQAESRSGRLWPTGHGQRSEITARANDHEGPKFHWFGYYDKLQFSPDNRYVLANQVDFEHRTPTPDDSIQVGMVDTQDGDDWIELGRSSAWCWQQGCMLQWLPGSRVKSFGTIAMATISAATFSMCIRASVARFRTQFTR